MKLFTIGDSISQGYMSLAAARTDLSFSTLIAKKMGLMPDYQYPVWEAGGLPANLEKILRFLERLYQTDIKGVEWLTVLPNINKLLDETEDYYERKGGKHTIPYSASPLHSDRPYFHNIAIQGFTIADAWQVTPRLCEETIEADESRRGGDQFLPGSFPSDYFYRIALRVLNPTLDDSFNNYSQLDWLQRHVKNEGVENLILWLGANNALGTVVDLEIRQTPNDSTQRPCTISRQKRVKARWNLWHPDDFAAEYDELIRRVDEIMRGDKNKGKAWRVFVGTIPQVTIAPLAKGVGPSAEIGDKGVYFKYYTYVPFEEGFAKTSGKHLTMREALLIDDCIEQYNETIKKVKSRPGGHYHVVDIAQRLRELAWKRNNGHPTHIPPDYFKFKYPPVNTKYYHADAKGRLRQGGLFSLDGVHPSAIGQGLIAYEFLRVMKKAGVNVDNQLNWPEIFASDSLYSKPIKLMQEIYQHEKLANFLFNLIRLMKD